MPIKSGKFFQKIVKEKIIRANRHSRNGLTGSFDECMAYFTGYTETHIQIDTPQAFLDLARRCVEHCQQYYDIDTLQLLMYAINRRVNPWKPVYPDSGNNILIGLIDKVIGDTTGIYARVYHDNPTIKRQDISLLFQAWLNAIEKEGPHKIDLQVYNRKQIQTFLPDSNTPKYQPSAQNEQQPFSRGGGLYGFLDILKGISPGYKNDNVVDDDKKSIKKITGIYVTPGEKDKRDHFYAYDFQRGRMYLDKPCRQQGRISKLFCEKTNNNWYEGFIQTKNLSQITHLKISFWDEHYRYGSVFQTRDFKTVEKYFPPTQEETLSRIQQIIDLDNARDEDRATLLEDFAIKNILLTHQDKIKSLITPHINDALSLCETYLRKQLKFHPPSDRKVSAIETLLEILKAQNDFTVDKYMENITSVIQANEATLREHRSPKWAFVKGAGITVLNIMHFHKVDSPFSSEGGRLIDALKRNLKQIKIKVQMVVEESSKQAVNSF